MSLTRTVVEPTPPSFQCTTICLASPEYYLRNLDGLPRGTVLIGGGGSSISTSNMTAMRLALDVGASAQNQFNRQFVAAQLSLLVATGPDVAALRSKLGCYGIHFAPVTLSQGTTITPNSSFGMLMETARQAARAVASKT